MYEEENRQGKVIMDSFLDYLKPREAELIKIKVELGGRIVNEELEAVRIYAGTMVAYRAYVVECLAFFNKYLDEATFYFMPDKTKVSTEATRKAEVEEKVSVIRMWRNLSKGLVDSIDKRVSYAQSELSFGKQYAKSIGQENN